MWLTCTCKKLIMLLKSKIIGNGSEALIILHGFLGMSDNWNSYAKKINDKGFQIHLLDQRNHGESFHSEEFNYEILSNDLKYYIDYHQIKNFSLIGHSLGGKTAMMFASTYPNTVKKLIVVDILPIYYKNDYENILQSLKSLDFKTYTFKIITVEHNYTENRDKIYNLLTENGFKRVYTEITDYDDWYVLIS